MVKTLKLAEGLTYCGVLDPTLSVFDIVMKTRYGTTYNAYVLKGAEKTALIDTAKYKFLDEYMVSLTALVDVRKIDYIVVSHTEPDHAGSIEHLIGLNPEIQIVGTATALGFLKHIVNRDFKSVAVKDGDRLSLGGKTLAFMPLPNLHWPDTMFTYIEEDKALITCDAFGAHYSLPDIRRSAVTDEAGYLDALKYYFDGIIGPFKRPYMTAALDRIRDLDIRMILTGHGPVLDSHVQETIERYRAWCAPDSPFEKKTVIVPYVSAYGYTQTLAKAIEEGLRTAGDLEVRLHDLVEEGPEAALREIAWADGFLLGTPTMVGEALAPIWNLTAELLPPVVRGKCASAFGSYGWSGEGVPHILERLKQLRLNVMDGLRVRFKPDEGQIAEARAFGERFGRLVLGEEAAEKPAPAARPEGKVRCTVCNAVFDADLDVCPVCGAKRDKFVPAEAIKPAEAPARPAGAGGAPAAKKVRCLICGEILDASAEICPVCGAGRESLVPFEEQAPAFARDTDERFLIIGGGAAGYHAAKAIRERNKTAPVVILSQEEDLPYNRPMLTKALLEDFHCDRIAISPRTWYDEYRITLLTGVTATAVDPENKRVTTSAGAVLAYDKLIYAAGARCFRPPIPGMALENVVTLRTAGDVKKIEALLPGVRSAVVIGGGVLGIEAAWELKKAGAGVTVIESMPRILPRQLDEGAARTLSAALEHKGVQLRTGAAVSKIEGDGKAARVVLKSGEEFPAELVIVSTGVVPNAEVLAAAGARVDRAVVVDSRMRTSLPDVFAAGDCAVCGGVNFALWAQAVDMGRAAGANAAGDDVEYRGVSGALTLNALDTTLYAVGEHGAGGAYRAEERRDDEKGFYEKRYFIGDRLAGFILIGDMARLAEFNAAFEGLAGNQLPNRREP